MATREATHEKYKKDTKYTELDAEQGKDRPNVEEAEIVKNSTMFKARHQLVKDLKENNKWDDSRVYKYLTEQQEKNPKISDSLRSVIRKCIPRLIRLKEALISAGTAIGSSVASRFSGKSRGNNGQSL